MLNEKMGSVGGSSVEVILVRIKDIEFRETMGYERSTEHGYQYNREKAQTRRRNCN